MRSHGSRYPETGRSKLTSGAPSCSRALKWSLLSVGTGTITQEMPLLFKGPLSATVGEEPEVEMRLV
jgi:hypothetical protein